MKQKALLFLCVTIFLGLGGLAGAQPADITITGHLLDSASNPIIGARDYAVTFHDAETAGNQLGTTRTGTVEPSDKGMFRISVEPTTETLAATAAWYALSIDSDTPTDGIDANDTFPERVPLQSVPFARRAEALTGAIPASQVANGVIDNAEFANLDGVTANIQTQIDAKADAAHGHGFSDLTGSATDAQIPDNITVTEHDSLLSVTARGSTTTAALEVGGLDVDSGTLYVDTANNRVGINETSPAEELHIRAGDTPNIRLHQDTAYGWPEYRWDIAGNESSFFIRDRETSTLPFKIRPGGYSNTLVVGSNAQVGVNTDTPSEALDVNGAVRLRDLFAPPTTTSNRLYNQSGVLYWGDSRIDALGGLAENWVIVRPGNDSETNGQLLVAAYDQAKALSPNGATLSATNRAVLIIPPGNYDLTTAGLTLDTSFVDLVGLTTHRDAQYIYGPADGVNSGVIMQIGNNVQIMNLTIECTASVGVLNDDATDPAAYWPTDGTQGQTTIKNCKFAGNAQAHGMRVGIDYAGLYENSYASGHGFGGYGIASGVFIDCESEGYSFAGSGTASGTFTRCVGGLSAFGGWQGTASGDFTDCEGRNWSFAGDGTASGTFRNCVGQYGAFGGASGAGGQSAGGTFTNCTGGDYSFGANGTAAAGSFYYCNGDGPGAWAGDEGTTAYCIKNGVAYP